MGKQKREYLEEREGRGRWLVRNEMRKREGGEVKEKEKRMVSLVKHWMRVESVHTLTITTNFARFFLFSFSLFLYSLIFSIFIHNVYIYCFIRFLYVFPCNGYASLRRFTLVCITWYVQGNLLAQNREVDLFLSIFAVINYNTTNSNMQCVQKEE